MVKICVFCSSTEGLNGDFVNAARKLGTLMGERKHHLVYGGSHRGLMREVSKNFSKHSSEITEIIPRMWADLIIGTGTTILTEDLGERLSKMKDLSDGFIALPGGFGSIHEVMDVLVARQLKLHSKPLVLININGIYDSFIDQLEKIVEHGLAPKDDHKLIHVVNTPEEALEYIENYAPIEIEDKN